MLLIDGSQGEGGGQILRSSLALSLLLSKPVRIERIRAGRAKPGLLRQHLCAVQAAARVGCAEVVGAELGSKELEFRPGPIVPGTYHFAIGSAGSTSLVLQTVLLPLLLSGGASTVTLEGGTHNPFAPPLEFLERSFGALLRRAGASVHVTIERYGFYPAGGGRIVARIEPATHLGRLDLLERGALRERRARIVVAGVPSSVAGREAVVLSERLGLSSSEIRVDNPGRGVGPGNVVLLELDFEHVTEVFVAFGARGRPAEQVAADVCAEAERYLAVDAPVGPHLADQLLLPMALGEGGSFRTTEVTPHTRTNADVLRLFLGTETRFEDLGDGRCLVHVEGSRFVGGGVVPA